MFIVADLVSLKAVHDLTLWPVVSVFGYEARGPGSIPVCAHIFSVFFSSLFNILMLNCFIY